MSEGSTVKLQQEQAVTPLFAFIVGKICGNYRSKITQLCIIWKGTKLFMYYST
jgi:hypothetical protein